MYETLNYGALQITCVKEDVSTSFAFREFNLTNIEVCILAIKIINGLQLAVQ